MISHTNSCIQSVFIKHEHHASLFETKQLNLHRGHGIEGDINADRLSPRQVLIVSAEDLTRLSIPPGELRENIVLEGANLAVFKPGAKIAFPSGAAIRLTFYCEPCKRVAHLVDSLKSIEKQRGILGVVIQGGAIAVDETVKILPNCFPALSEVPYERFLDFLAKVPQGKVVTYKQILKGIGVDRSYFRVIPLYIKKAPVNYPIHRILDSQGHILCHIPQQKERLEAEGIEVVLKGDRYFVPLEKYAWKNSIICSL